MMQNQLAAYENYQQYTMSLVDFKTAEKHTIFVSLIEGNPETSSLKVALVKPIK